MEIANKKRRLSRAIMRTKRRKVKYACNLENSRMTVYIQCRTSNDRTKYLYHLRKAWGRSFCTLFWFIWIHNEKFILSLSCCIGMNWCSITYFKDYVTLILDLSFTVSSNFNQPLNGFYCNFMHHSVLVPLDCKVTTAKGIHTALISLPFHLIALSASEFNMLRISISFNSKTSILILVAASIILLLTFGYAFGILLCSSQPKT